MTTAQTRDDLQCIVLSQSSRRRAKLPLVGSAVAPVRLAVTPLETCGVDDRFHDYVLAEYEPIAPALGRIRSMNVLVESFALAGVEREGYALISAIRDGLGPFRTVWGIKRHADGSLGWELYFYDFQRVHADLSIERVISLLTPHVRVAAREPRPLPWHMFSIELDLTGLRNGAPSAVDIYIDMRSYKCTNEELVFENVYTFHDSKAEIEEVLHRVRSCIHFDPNHDELQRLMPPHLFNCRKICVANKRKADAMYFSRIPTTALARFLRDQQWPSALQAFVRTHDDALSHLLWDVGIDFRAIEGRATIIKSGIYGSF